MIKQHNATIKIIPVDSVHILNPRVRNAKVFEGIVDNITKVGLKRPITVTHSRSRFEGKEYDLVCGQGRLEAFMACGQKEIPAMVIDASEEQALIMSLVENVARRKHKPFELLQGVEILRKQGYDAKTIAAKIGHKPEYTMGVIKLLEQGEEKLVSAVEAGHIPITLAINIVQSPQNEQAALQEAYETGNLSGHKFMKAKRLLEDRKNTGKVLRDKRKRGPQRRTEDVSAREILKAYKREVERKRLLSRKADVVNTRLLFLVEAMRCLMQEDHFTTLLRAESLETMPKQLAGLLAAKRG
ncbi:MAG: ParB N-terminal domain-containing protein [Pseudomonadota bacterium]|nr:ParB N-terminal domain-containing protein [Pseudomonadota bacterium]MDE3038849.1 ParB N-terminal domain-containing protein [Pseudomonadota bacterium]